MCQPAYKNPYITSVTLGLHATHGDFGYCCAMVSSAFDPWQVLIRSVSITASVGYNTARHYARTAGGDNRAVSGDCERCHRRLHPVSMGDTCVHGRWAWRHAPAP